MMVKSRYDPAATLVHLITAVPMRRKGNFTGLAIDSWPKTLKLLSAIGDASALPAFAITWEWKLKP